MIGRKPRVTPARTKRLPGPPSAADVRAVEAYRLLEPNPSTAPPMVPPIRGPPTLLAYSIRQFAELHGISVDFYYKMQRQGWGPQTMRCGGRTLISFEAAAEWRRRCEAARVQPTEEEV
jgi:hypothetical protein